MKLRNAAKPGFDDTNVAMRNVLHLQILIYIGGSYIYILNT